MKRSAIACLVVLAAMVVPRAAPPIRVMLLDGESGGPYHRWQLTTQVLKKELDEAGLFDVAVVTAPPPGGSFSAFKPDFAKYQVVVMNYDAPDERWPAELKTAFERYVSDGGGLVIVHASDNAFPGWTAFNDMIGVGGWRNRTEKAGPFWFYQGRQADVRRRRRDRQAVTDSGCRSLSRFAIRIIRSPGDCLRSWMHQGDELYAMLRGPGRNMTVLATAHSDPANNGTGRDEPQLMVLSYGKGRVFHTTMGHDVSALSSVDFVVTFQRGTEWAANGAVTQKIPSDFPTADQRELSRESRGDGSAAAAGASRRPRVAGQPRRRAATGNGDAASRIHRSRCAPDNRSLRRNAASVTDAMRWAAKPGPTSRAPRASRPMCAATRSDLSCAMAGSTKACPPSLSPKPISRPSSPSFTTRKRRPSR